LVVPEVLEVHVVPSDEVRILPDAPTAMKVLFSRLLLGDSLIHQMSLKSK